MSMDDSHLDRADCYQSFWRLRFHLLVAGRLRVIEHITAQRMTCPPVLVEDSVRRYRVAARYQ